MYTLEQGTAAVRAARTNLEHRLNGRKAAKSDLWPEGVPDEFQDEAGVFVTLLSHPRELLRGCVGYPEPVKVLHRAVTEMAVAAATRDTRFRQVKTGELDRLIVEVTLLGPPRKVEFERPAELLMKVVVGRDGLIIDKGHYRGVLLPQVPVERGWDVTQYLANCCLKAGLMADAWAADEGVEVLTFSGQLFKEKEPGGEVEEVHYATEP